MKSDKMWHQEAIIAIPVILSATGLIPKSLFHNLDIINLKDDIYKNIQKTIIIHTCSLTRRFMANITYTHPIEQ